MKKIEKEVKEEVCECVQKSRKEYLLDLYKTLQEEGIRSISDLENKIANS